MEQPDISIWAQGKQQVVCDTWHTGRGGMNVLKHMLVSAHAPNLCKSSRAIGSKNQVQYTLWGMGGSRVL